MSPQADYVVSNGTGAAVRSDINGQLAAIVSNNSGASAPATTYAYQFWADTSTSLLKVRNGANSAWITVGDLTAANLGLATLASPTFTGTATIPTLTVSTAANIPLGSAASPTLYFTGDSNTGLYSPGADQLALSTGGTGRLFVDSSGNVGVGLSSPAATFGKAGSIDANGIVVTRGAVNAHQTNAGVFQYNANETTIRSYGATAGTGVITFNTGGGGGSADTERARIDSSGRLGVGTTTPSSLLSLGGSATAQKLLVYEDGANSRYGFGIQAGEIRTFAASSGVLTFGHISTSDATTYSEKARIDTSGRLLVGTSSDRSIGGGSRRFQIEEVSGTYGASIVRNANDSQGALFSLGKSRGSAVLSNTVVNNGDTLGGVEFYGADGTTLIAGASLYAQVDATPGTNDMPGRLVFSTTADGASSPTERMRIGQNGQTDCYTSGGDGFTVRSSNAAGTSLNLFAGLYSATNTQNGSYSVAIRTNGNILNTNGSYTSLSDAKLKENIIDAGSQWGDLKAIKIRNWNFREDTGYETHRQIGPIAQELEEVCPSLVFTTPDRNPQGDELGTSTKSINQSVLYMKAVKALQEAMERIEQLEAKVAALESA